MGFEFFRVSVRFFLFRSFTDLNAKTAKTAKGTRSRGIFFIVS